MNKYIKNRKAYIEVIQRKFTYGKLITKKLLKTGKIAPGTLIILENKKLVYLVISKTGNSSIKTTFIESNVPDNYSIHRKDWHIVYTLNDDMKNYYKFTFVRNPFDRLVSCYVSKYHEDQKRGMKLRFSHYLFGVIKKDKGFDNFVKNVLRIPTFLADDHFIRQYALVYKNGKSLVDYIGKFENMKEDFEAIKQKFKLSDLPHFNKSKKGNWMDYYTLETAKLVYNHYKKDIEIFGYQEEYQTLISYLQEKSKKENNELI